MIKTIISDYDGVLIPDEYRGARQFCPDVSWLESAETPYYIEPDNDRFWDEVRSMWNVSFSNQVLADLYNQEDQEQRDHEQKVLATYAALKSQRSLFLLSNQLKHRADYIRNKPSMKIFDQLYFSNEMGLAKPDAAIFLTVVKGHGLKPEETLFIDDRRENLETAKALGMQTVLFEDLSALAKIEEVVKGVGAK